VILDDDEVCARAGRAAAALRRRGLAAGDAVAVLAGNTPDFVVARDAATALELVFVPIHPRAAPAEIADQVARSGARLLLADRPHDGAVPIAALDGAGSASLRAGAMGATLPFTSGSAGRPKPCLRPEPAEAARGAELIASYGLGPDDVHLVACPLAHSAPGILLRAARAVGARTILLERQDRFVEAADDATVVFLVPTQIARLVDGPAPRRLRAVIVGGAPFPPALKARALAWLGPGRLWELYGSTETGTIAVAPPSAQPGPAGFVGWAPPGVEVELADDGEVRVRSAACMSGYLGEPPRAPDAFLATGDLARRGADGALILVDRKSDLILSGGANVYPAEVERALAEHPLVRGAVVYGRPHPEWGEEVCALVAAAAPLAADALVAFLRERVAAYKIPKRFRFVGADELPVGPTGKPLRRRARADDP
jgi:acyl-CoA synthetase (AMP-forming)/AMP-acid ligase II